MRSTRRALLSHCGALAGIGMAGCIRNGTPVDDEPTDGNRQTTDDGTASGTPGRLLAAPTAFGLEHYAFTVMRPAAMLEHRAALSSSLLSKLTSDLRVAGLGSLGEVERAHQFANVALAYEGSHDAAATENQLRDRGFEERGTHRGYRLLANAGARAAAVGDDLYVVADGSVPDVTVTGVDVVRTIVDARAGTVDRYGHDPDCGQLLSTFGDAYAVRGRTDPPGAGTVDGAAAEGASWQLGNSSTEVTVAVVFQGQEAVDQRAVREWVVDAEPLAGTDPTLARDGRIVTASTDLPTGDVKEVEVGWARPPDELPVAEFSFEYDPDSGTVTVTFQSGETVDRSKLYVRGSGFADREGADQTAAGPWQGGTNDDGRVLAGNRVVVGVRAEYELRVVYDDGTSTKTLSTDEGPDA